MKLCRKCGRPISEPQYKFHTFHDACGQKVVNALVRKWRRQLLIEKIKGVIFISNRVLIIILIALMALLLFTLIERPVFANPPQPFSMTICHYTPGNQVEHTFTTAQAYAGHLGTPHSVSTFDTQGPCVSPSPSVSPSATPTLPPIVWPSVLPSVSPSVTPQPSRTPEPTPQYPTPVFTQLPVSCGDPIPQPVANIYVDSGVIGDGQLEVRWTPTGNPQPPKAHIRYGLEIGNYPYALLETDNDGKEVIGALTNGTHYFFEVAQVSGVCVGNWSLPYDPLP